MRAFIAVTDNEWFRFLSAQLGIDEVNFWQPSGGREFRVLQAGEPLLFKLHSPESFVVGGGFFVRYTRLPHSMAWDVFGIKNGTATLEEMRRRIERYRRIGPSNEDYEMGCIVLAQPFFFGRDDWFPPPADFSPNVQTGKSYDLTSEPYGTQLWDDVALRTMARDLDIDMEIEESPPTMFGEPILVRPRLGQARSACWSPKHTKGVAQSLARRSCLSLKQLISVRSRWAASTASTTVSCCAPTSIRSSTRAT